MLPTAKGSLRLFRVAGITVYLHWLWFAVAAYEISDPASRYHSLVWNALEYLALFGIVLLHEFGHALACRSVGGQANQIVLWPLGGVAYVNPPQRPGATLWSIAAGPLVNVVLLVVLSAVGVAGNTLGWWQPTDNVRLWLRSLWIINFALLAFNLLPFYPLDGGQIVRSLLWYFVGRARSLLVATVIGFVGVAGLIALAVLAQSVWLGILAAFILMSCWRSLQTARTMVKLDKMPRHDHFRCPTCHESPQVGEFWQCHACGTAFDTFATSAACPKCAMLFSATKCLNCGTTSPFSGWLASPVPPPLIPH